MKQDRQSTRLQGYDYTRNGAYFITILTYQRALIFSEVENSNIQLLPEGRFAEECWLDIPNHFPFVRLDTFVIMPNHIHGILVIERDGTHVRAHHGAPLHVDPSNLVGGRRLPGSLATIIALYKQAVTVRTNQYRKTPGWPVWHRNYHERIIRNQTEHARIRRYIESNPKRWKPYEAYKI